MFSSIALNDFFFFFNKLKKIEGEIQTELEKKIFSDVKRKLESEHKQEIAAIVSAQVFLFFFVWSLL